MGENEARIRQFLKERFGGYTDDLGSEDKLDKVVDSMGLFELVTFLEEEFSLSIPNEEFSPDLFSSIGKILDVVEEFRAA